MAAGPKLRREAHAPRPRLALLERIALAPRQSLALVEAEGRRFLVATSPEGAPAFYALDARVEVRRSARRSSRSPSATLNIRILDRVCPSQQTGLASRGSSW
jgi:flagellar biogenesis protein FliO